MLCTVIYEEKKIQTNKTNQNTSNNALYYFIKEQIRIQEANKNRALSFLTLSMRWGHLKSLFSGSSNTLYLIDKKALNQHL